MSPHRAISSIGLICAVLVVTGLTGCTASDDRSEPQDTLPPSVSDDGGEALPGVELPAAAGATGVVVQVPGELDTLIAAHASARDDLRACIDDHATGGSGVDAQRFPC